MISIIIPSQDRPEPLTRCLRAIATAGVEDPGARFEVIVVNDGGAMALEPVVSAFRDRLHVVLLEQAHAGPAAARNAGAALARGQFLAFLDDDCVPAANWLQTLTARFAAAPTRAIGGRTLNGLPDNLYSCASQLLADYLYEYFNPEPQQPSFFASNNLALPREGFHVLGGFDSRFPSAAGEDRDLCDRWLRHGYQMTYAPEVLIYHAHTLTLRTFWKQHFNYGRGAFCFRRARAQRNNRRISLEPLTFYLNLLCSPFSRARRRRASLLATLVLSQVANAMGFLWERRRFGRAHADSAARTRTDTTGLDAGH